MATKPKATQKPKPQTSDEWMMLEFEIQRLFDGAPVDEEQLFAGRSKEVNKMLQTVMERAKHVVLFGERGVGKTSLSNIFWKRYGTTLQSFIVARVQCGPHDDFSSVWIRGLEELKAMGISRGRPDYVNFDTNFTAITPSQVRRELQKINPNALPIIIFDEYDKVTDGDTKVLMANIVKELYDFAVHTTVIIVGVAENISELIADHASIGRALVDVPLHRMSESELREIIHQRIRQTPMTFSNDAIWTVVILSRGLPFFTQTLSKLAALNAIKTRRLNINNGDVAEAMKQFIEDTAVSFRDAYGEATRTNQKNNLKETLLACALAKSDDEGFFKAADLIEPLSAIMKDRRRIAHFEKHLRRFSGDDGGKILSRRGGDRQQMFRFADPMMQPYVIINGIQSGMIDEDAKNLLFQKEQREFAI
ncbi:AAA family ATPase [Mesorhizobium sp. LNHC252B00]|uniref:nSTAND1 domain-containing NTPase n=1 Tax=Mesorhizobium sp. LNHC252B00 TaxID=1287252 RepID=UPI000403CDAF|nr:AAA family ATPase [Mesorhizobium sp. LNHC252B00]